MRTLGADTTRRNKVTIMKKTEELFQASGPVEFERRLKTRINRGSEPIGRKTHREDGNASEDLSVESKGQERDEPRMGERAYQGAAASPESGKKKSTWTQNCSKGRTGRKGHNLDGALARYPYHPEVSANSARDTGKKNKNPGQTGAPAERRREEKRKEEQKKGSRRAEGERGSSGRTK